jgi:hypothetical protein
MSQWRLDPWFPFATQIWCAAGSACERIFEIELGHYSPLPLLVAPMEEEGAHAVEEQAPAIVWEEQRRCRERRGWCEPVE